jgi:hypothetical protein
LEVRVLSPASIQLLSEPSIPGEDRACFALELAGHRRVMRVVVLIVWLTAVVFVSGCGGGDDDEGSGGYPADAVSNFMASCEPSAVESSQGALTAEEARTMCRCVIDDLQQTLPLDEFLEYDERAREDPSDPPTEVTDALEKCSGA